MREIDLIPSSYRMRQSQRRWIQRASLLLGTLLTACLSARAALGLATGTVETEIETLRARQTITLQESQELVHLDEKNQEFRRRLTLLEGLRSGTAAEDMFLIIDRALDDDVWFLRWEFQRAGAMAGNDRRTVETGYFIVVPNGEDSELDAWQIETHMKITGQSRDHVALSEFVKRLLAQPGIRDVRVRRTTLRRYTAMTVVDFDLAVVVNSGTGN